MREENEILLEKFIGYEEAFAELFRELGLKAAQCELVRAFLIVSNGQIEFEASYFDLAQVHHKTNGKDYKNLNDKIRYAFGVLQKWQQENKLTLVEVVEKGSRKNEEEGKFTYSKSKYKFVLLAEIAEAIADNPENVEAVVKETIARLKEQFVPVEKAKKYHPNHLIKRKKNTIFTLLKSIFRLAIEAGDNPYNRCKTILNQAWDIVEKLETEHSAYQGREKFIANFESQLNKESMEGNEMDSNL